MKIKKIGLRTFKTAIAVFLCCMFYFAMQLIELIDGVPDDLAFTIYNPFFASIATAYSMGSTRKKSYTQAKDRCIASFIGGGVGIALVAIFELFAPWPLLSMATIKSSIAVEAFIAYVLTALCVIITVILGLLFRQPNAIFVAILTLTSVTINPNESLAASHGICAFGLNRIGSTIVGVLIALGVNTFRLPRFNKNKDILFMIGIEGALAEGKEKLHGFFEYKIHEFIDMDINLSLYTTRPPMTFIHILPTLNLKCPVVCCSGAALYDTREHKYLYTCPLPLNTNKVIIDKLKEMNAIPFVNYVIDDSMFITVSNKNYRFNNFYYRARIDRAYCNIFEREILEDKEVLNYLLIDTKDNIDKIYEAFKDNYYCVISEVLDDFGEEKDLRYLKIYNKNVKLMYGIKEYAYKNGLRIASLTSSSVSNYLLEASDIKATFESNKTFENPDIIIKSNSYNELFKEINTIYYSKKYKK